MLFTLEQIQSAHAKTKTGADFPDYIKEIKELGVIAFETWVIDGHTEYFGKENFVIKSQPEYENLEIYDKSDKVKFGHYLKIHQQGETDYFAFCKHCAETGIEKWIMSLQNMTCTYFDKSGKEILAEKIPQ